MRKGIKAAMIAGGAVAVLAAGGAAIAGAAGGDDDAADRPIAGAALDRASAAALAETGGGKVTDTEMEEEGAYEVEVMRADGSQVEIQLDRNFAVLGSERDDDEGDAAGDD
jgi:uncharacterized membrane protein YkoI